MSLTLITAPASEPITLADVKLHARISTSAEDSMISGVYIPAARVMTEHKLQRSLLTQTLEMRLDSFPDDPGVIVLERGPVQSITYVKYVDANGATQTVTSTDYYLDATSELAQVMPGMGKSWPDTGAAADAVMVRYVAGYGAALSAQQSPIKLFMLALASLMYNARDADAEKILQRHPWVEHLLDPFVEQVA